MNIYSVNKIIYNSCTQKQKLEIHENVIFFGKPRNFMLMKKEEDFTVHVLSEKLY